MPPEKLDPQDDEPGTTHDHIERLQCLLFAEPLRPFDQELQVGLDGREIDVLGVTSRQDRWGSIWHVGSRQSRGNRVSAKLGGSFTASPRSVAVVMPDDG